MTAQGLPSELCRWTQSFLSDRHMQLNLNGLLGDLYLLTLGIPQGSPVSPVLACLYAAPVLHSFMTNPDTTSILPVGPRSYVDDMGFLAISDSLHENTLVLEWTLQQATRELDALGMSIDPTKCDLMHFSWKRSDDSSPSIVTTLYNKPLRITLPKYIRWLGFFLDRKLSFKHHINILLARGRHVITGIQCLGNTIHVLNAHHLRLLYKTCVIPVITYGCQLWFDPHKPSRTLIKKLQVIQNIGLRRIAGAFRTTPVEPLHVLTFCQGCCLYLLVSLWRISLGRRAKGEER